MMGWLLLQDLGTVFSESGINLAAKMHRQTRTPSPLRSGEINAAAYCCEITFLPCIYR